MAAGCLACSVKGGDGLEIRLMGSHLCQDTLYALMKLKDQGVKIEFCNISTNFPALKEFMTLRETDPIFEPVKERGGLGMPLFVLKDGIRTLSLEQVLDQARSEKQYE